MNYTEENDIPGLLLLIDFEKAFDSLSWEFVHNTLSSFTFEASIKNGLISFIKMQHQLFGNVDSYPNLSMYSEDVVKATLFHTIYLYYVQKFFPLS
jgi:hypothetical protein